MNVSYRPDRCLERLLSSCTRSSPVELYLSASIVDTQIAAEYTPRLRGLKIGHDCRQVRIHRRSVHAE
jgi:hypothetical protein